MQGAAGRAAGGVQGRARTSFQQRNQTRGQQEKRLDDGKPYSWSEFQSYYGDDAIENWNKSFVYIDVSNILRDKNCNLNSKMRQLTTIINKSCQSLDQATSILTQMQDNGIKPDEVTCTAIINKHYQSLDEALKFLNQMQDKGIKPNKVTYTTIINKHCQSLDEALEFLKQMQDKGIKPDEVTYSIIINLALTENNMHRAKEFYDQIGENHKPIMRDGNTLNLHMVMVGCAKYSILMHLDSNASFKIDPGKGTHSRRNPVLCFEIPKFLQERSIMFESDRHGIITIQKMRQSTS